MWSRLWVYWEEGKPETKEAWELPGQAACGKIWKFQSLT